MSEDVVTGVRVAYLVAAVCFVLGLHLMNSPATARRGNQLSAAGMTLAVAAALTGAADGDTMTAGRWTVLLIGVLVGSAAGLWAARSVAMTAIPQLVSLFNAVGGGAAAIVALADVVRRHSVSGGTATAAALDAVIGAVTFSGSLVAAAKLQGWWSHPVAIRGGRALSALLLGGAATAAGLLISGAAGPWVLWLVAGAALVLGVLGVLPIGGADMPVVISLLNAGTGTAVAMAGFVVDNLIMVVAGALVGASGGILTKLMADAMNRSVGNIIGGGFGTGDGAAAVVTATGASVRSISADDAALQLAYAGKVIVVPGYGLAAAQAQHEVSELADLLEKQGVEVSYAIHPVAGRMPGHMNVLLAEADVPYEQMREMSEVNPEFARTDVALVIGANDVTNPAARRPGNAVSGMPILDVDEAKNVIVVKRSLGHGYAGIDNELYANPRTSMLFGDAKSVLSQLIAAVRTFVA